MSLLRWIKKKYIFDYQGHQKHDHQGVNYLQDVQVHALEGELECGVG